MNERRIGFSKIFNWLSEKGIAVKNGGVDDNHFITAPRAIELCHENNITFLTQKYKDKATQLLMHTKSKLIILPKEIFENVAAPEGKALVIYDAPKELLIDFCKAFLDFGAPNAAAQIHPTAVIEEGAVLGENNVIGAGVFISKNCKIGSYNTIGAHSVIKNTTIHDHVNIGCNTTIGETGFGYTKDDDGEVELFPHYGSVVIESHVHVGNNTCIDRGSLSDTVIKEGAKIDNLVHIAHNVQVGKNSFVIACSMIAGSVVLGDNSWIAPSSAVRNGLSVGKNTTVGIGSTVTKNVGDDETVLGSPAVSINEFKLLRKKQKQWLDESEKH